MTARGWMSLAAVLLIGGVLAGCGDDDSSDAEAETRYSTSWVLTARHDIDGGVAANDEVAVMLGGDRTDGVFVAFSSADGREWEPGEGLPVVEDFGPSAAVAGGSSGFVAIATRNGSVPNSPVVAFSADGSEWQEVDPTALPEDEVSWLRDVVAGEDGFVVVAELERRAVAWFSADGRDWTETDLSVADSALTVATDGSRWMAIGAEYAEYADGAGAAVVFVSDDGREWTAVDVGSPVPAAAIPAYAGPSPLAVHDNSWVLAAREADSFDDGVWASTDDGETWGAVSIPGDVTLVYDLVAVPDGLVLIGTSDPLDEGPAAPELWYSDDGSQWHVHPAVSELVSITPLGEELVTLDVDGNVFVWSAAP